MKFRKTTLLFVLFLGVIITFDALQQHYYLTNFNILDDASEISLLSLIYSHSLRWLIWAFSSIPLIWYSWNKFSNTKLQIPSSVWIKISFVSAFCWFLSMVLLTAVNTLSFESAYTLADLVETFTFFVFQKGITFLFAYGIMILAVFNYARNLVIEAQELEIQNLKSTSSTVDETSKTEPQVSIRIGNKMKVIPLSEVTWIESDDYCVKIHTEQKSYSLRKSLKSLEEQLAPYRFIRVHRGALLNLGYLDQVDFEQSMIKLQDSSELPLSKSGAQVLKKALKASSI